MKKSKILPPNYKSNIKALREENTTVKELLDYLKEKGFNTSERAYRTYENDLVMPPISLAYELADKYHVTIDYLLGLSDCKSVDNEYIHQVTGLSDGAINQLKKLVKTDSFLEQSNEKNANRNDSLSVRPVHFISRIRILNFVLESKHFPNLITDFIYFLHSDKYKKLLDGTFHELPTNEVVPADENGIAGGLMLEINSDWNKAQAKNLLDIQVEKLAQEYKKLSKIEK